MFILILYILYLVCGKIEDKSGGRLRKPVNNFFSYWFSSPLQCEHLHMLFTIGSFAITNIVISLNKQSISDLKFMLSLAFQVNIRTHTLNAIVCRFFDSDAAYVKWCLAGLADVKRHKNNSRKYLVSFNFPRQFTWIENIGLRRGKVRNVTRMSIPDGWNRMFEAMKKPKTIFVIDCSRWVNLSASTFLHTSTLFQPSDNVINESMEFWVNFCSWRMFDWW